MLKGPPPCGARAALGAGQVLHNSSAGRQRHVPWIPAGSGLTCKRMMPSWSPNFCCMRWSTFARVLLCSFERLILYNEQCAFR